ncbi:MAG TPA: DNA internalization-related competence protein ComEC/Rec2, partial [Polyangiaceae bacterium]|nr:DNA internalization-related competence protein ComEC/Rec2 [Polyangiaceae bacterium]
MALLGSGSLLFVRWIARNAASLDVLAFDTPRPTDWHLVMVGLLGACLLLYPRRRFFWAWLGGLLWVVFESWAVFCHQPKGRLRITVLDVGQGDSVMVDFPDGRGMLVDGGGVVGSPMDPGLRVVAPVL